MRTSKILLIAALALVLLVLGTASIAGVGCDLAQGAGWHHPGLNGWCFYEVIADLWLAGYDTSQVWA